MRFIERPDTPAQAFAALAGLFLVALGALSLIFGSTDFGSLATADAPADFLVWSVTGWTGVFWAAMGAFGLLSMARLEPALMYAASAAAVFTVAAVWGFIGGNAVFVDAVANNVTHLVLAVIGLVCALPPRESQREPADDRRFDREPAEYERVGRW